MLKPTKRQDQFEWKVQSSVIVSVFVLTPSEVVMYRFENEVKESDFLVFGIYIITICFEFP